jgi:HEAT repeat protein
MASALDFLMSFQWALKACRLYGTGHPRNREALAGLENSYKRFLDGKQQVQVATRNGRMFVDKELEDSKNIQIKNLASDLEERSIHALILYPAATREELQVLVNLLCLKPNQLKEQGGAKKILEEKEVKRIRILAARLEDVSEAGEITAALLESVASVAGMLPRPQEPGHSKTDTVPGKGGTSALAALLSGSGKSTPPPVSLEGLVSQLRGALLAQLQVGDSLDLSSFGAVLQQMGMDSQGVQPGTQGAVRQAVASLAPDQQVNVFRGAAQLRPGPLRNLFSRLASSMAAPSFAATYAHNLLSEDQAMEFAEQLKPLSASPERWGEQLADALRKEGMSEGQLRELVDILTWETQPMATKLAKLLEGQRIFETPVEKVLAFMRELLEAGRNHEFLRLLRHFGSGLLAPAVARRSMVAKAFEKIADWADIPGMPHDLLNELIELLSRAYGREKDPEVHQWLSLAIEHVLWYWVDNGEPEVAHALFNDLQDVVTELSLPAPWKAQATSDLLSRLGAPDRINKVLTQLFTMDRQVAIRRIHPYLKMLGTTAAEHLVERLADEPDRTKRAHLLEALKACGSLAEAPLLESLKSEEWYVVRNSLIILAEITTPERIKDLSALISHPDIRVAVAAIRAVGRIGGRQAEAAIVPLVLHRDPAIQTETLFILKEMKSKQAIPALIELVKTMKGRLKPEQEKIRERAVELLGTLESTSVIPVLEELLVRRRSFFRDAKEPLSIRLAALRSLVQMDSQEAQETIRKSLDAEPKGPERDALNKSLTDCLMQNSVQGQ